MDKNQIHGTEVSWVAIANDQTILRGHLLTEGSQITYCGPVCAIDVSDTGEVRISAEWFAEKKSSDKKRSSGWRFSHDGIPRIIFQAADCPALMLDGGIITFTVPCIGQCFLYPMETFKLNPEHVVGYEEWKGGQVKENAA